MPVPFCHFGNWCRFSFAKKDPVPNGKWHIVIFNKQHKYTLDMKEILSIVLVIIGALIGAGFASGQEIYSFFYAYGEKGIIGIIVTSTLTSVLIYKTLKMVCQNEITTYNEFLGLVIKNKKITKIINIVLNILLLISFYIMIAGFGAYFEQEMKINKIIGSLILAILCAIIFFTSVKGVLKVSSYIVPILIISIILIGTIAISTSPINITQIPVHKKMWLMSAITYCSYNLILLIPVLISLREHIKSEKSIKYIAIITGIIMLILSSIIFFILTKTNVDIKTLEMPIVYIIRNYYPKLQPLYAFIILSSIFTTAISVGIGFLQNIMGENKKSYTQFVLIMCISSLLISNFGFSKLVNFAYPFFGYLGIIQILNILYSKKCCKK